MGPRGPLTVGTERLSERLYRALVRLYPRAFRARFVEEMVQLFGDQLNEARTKGRPLGLTTTWFRTLGDLLVTAASEHVRGDRGVGHSLSRPPSPGARVLASAGVLGGIVLLAAFVVDIAPGLNNVRIGLFYIGAIAIVVALYRHMAAVAPRLALAVSAGVILGNLGGLVLEVLSIGRPVFPEADPEFRLIGFYGAVVMWLADAALGAAIWRTRVAARWIGLLLAVASAVALTGNDRFELVRGDWAWLFVPLALTAVAGSGLAWIALGVDVATRRRPQPAPAAGTDRDD
jgi:hypothetical protein